MYKEFLIMHEHFYYAGYGANNRQLEREVADWCADHIGNRWRFNKLTNYEYPNKIDFEEDARTAIIFENASDWLAFKLRWL